MATSNKNAPSPPPADKESGRSDPAEQRRCTCWLVIACIIVIVITAALIAIELSN